MGSAEPAPVLFDHREARSGIPSALEAAGIPVAPAQLPAGDYVLSDRLVVERKTGADLAASIKNRRLFEQVDRLRRAYAAVVLLVGGEPVHISEASWKGALGRVLVAGVAVLRTEGPDDTAAWLAGLHRLEGKGPSEARGLPRPRRPMDDLAAVADLPSGNLDRRRAKVARALRVAPGRVHGGREGAARRHGHRSRA